jgi:hypothetical protein
VTGGGHISWPLVQFTIIGEAWRLYTRQWVVWSMAMLISLAGYAVVNGTLIAIVGDQPTSAGRCLVGLSSIMTTGFFVGGMVRMASRQIRGQVPRIEDLFSVTDVWFDLCLCSLLYSLATCVASLFCVIPGLIVPGLFMLGTPLVVEARLPATGALIQSWNVLKSQWLLATCFHLVLIVCAYSGFMLCFFGVLVTGPVYCLSLAILYHDFFPTSAKASWTKHAEPFPEI